MKGQMEKEKIIEEMAWDLAGSCDECAKCQQQSHCLSYEYATRFYNAGYRRVDNGCTIKMQGESELQKVFDELLEGNTYVTIKEKEVEIEQAKQEVAREIFAELDEVFLTLTLKGGEKATIVDFKRYAELKKKYTGE